MPAAAAATAGNAAATGDHDADDMLRMVETASFPSLFWCS